MPVQPLLPANAIAAHQAEQARLKRQQVQFYDQVAQVPIYCPPNTVVSGTTIINQLVVYESTFTVSFVNTFTEKPQVTTGWELDQSSVLQPGFMPQVTVGVAAWVRESSGSLGVVSGKPYGWYTGASVVVVTTALPGTNLWAHITFSGRALSYSNTATSATGSPTTS